MYALLNTVDGLSISVVNNRIPHFASKMGVSAQPMFRGKCGLSNQRNQRRLIHVVAEPGVDCRLTLA